LSTAFFRFCWSPRIVDLPAGFFFYPETAVSPRLFSLAAFFLLAYPYPRVVLILPFFLFLRGGRVTEIIDGLPPVQNPPNSPEVPAFSNDSNPPLGLYSVFFRQVLFLQPFPRFSVWVMRITYLRLLWFFSFSLF